MLKPGDVVELDGEFDCPFCGVKMYVEKFAPNSGIMHVEPICEKFDKLEPEEYIIECHLKMGLTVLN